MTGSDGQQERKGWEVAETTKREDQRMSGNSRNIGDGLAPIGPGATTWEDVAVELERLRDNPDVAPGVGSLQDGWRLAFDRAVRMARERSA